MFRFFRFPRLSRRDVQVFGLSLTSALLLWAAFPPWGMWPLAWVAPIGWLLLIRDETPLGRWGYLAVWLGGCVMWLALLQGIRLPHPALYAGWIALSGYLAVYPLLFVGLGRSAVHNCRVSLVLAAPIVWVGLEYLRGHALTGFSMALLAHSQMSQTLLIQVADTFGAYAVSFLMMLTAACVVNTIPVRGKPSREGKKWNWQAAGLAVAVVCGMTAYGRFRLSESSPVAGQPSQAGRELQVALIQGSFDTFYEFNPERNQEIYERYRELSRQAAGENAELDLLIWPESVFTGDLAEILIEDDIDRLQPPADVDYPPEEYRQLLQHFAGVFAQKVRDNAGVLNASEHRSKVHLLVGTDTQTFTAEGSARYNSALMIDPAGEVAGRYYKMHRVMFGEYLPFGDTFPGIYDWTPMPGGITAGRQPQALVVDGVHAVPSICFESTVPHLIRQNVAWLRRQGKSPALLVNLTNDGWFLGSSILDLHLACNVFRAVENRLPMLVAANTGISAAVSSDGRILARGPRRDERVLHATIPIRQRTSLYHQLGDWPSLVCLLTCGLFAGMGWRRRRMALRSAKSPQPAE